MKEYESIISTTCMKTELIATENKITISYTYNDTNDEYKHRDYDYIKEYANDWKTTYIYENGIIRYSLKDNSLVNDGKSYKISLGMDYYLNLESLWAGKLFNLIEELKGKELRDYTNFSKNDLSQKDIIYNCLTFNYKYPKEESISKNFIVEFASRIDDKEEFYTKNITDKSFSIVNNSLSRYISQKYLSLYKYNDELKKYELALENLENDQITIENLLPDTNYTFVILDNTSEINLNEKEEVEKIAKKVFEIKTLKEEKNESNDNSEIVPPSEQNPENPNTGDDISFIIITIGIILSSSLIILSIKRNKMYKI